MKRLHFVSGILVIAMALFLGAQIRTARMAPKTPSEMATSTPTPKPTATPAKTTVTSAKPAATPKPAASPKPKPTTTPKTPTTPAAKPLTESSVLGDYQVSPVTSPADIGKFEAIPNSGGKLKWTNLEKRSWTLTPDYATGILKTEGDNPYLQFGYRDFTLVVKEGKVTGFTFVSWNFEKVTPVRSTTESMVVGKYQVPNREGDWEKGELVVIPNSSGKLKWTNKMGNSWTLTPDYANGVLKTGDDNPWKANHINDFRLVFDQGKYIGFVFHMLYTKKSD